MNKKLFNINAFTKKFHQIYQKLRDKNEINNNHYRNMT